MVSDLSYSFLGLEQSANKIQSFKTLIKYVHVLVRYQKFKLINKINKIFIHEIYSTMNLSLSFIQYPDKTLRGSWHPCPPSRIWGSVSLPADGECDSGGAAEVYMR